MKIDLNKFEIGDRLYLYYIMEAKLNRAEIIVKDDTVRTREPVGFSLDSEDYIIAITGDGYEWWVGIYDNILYLVSEDGLHEMESSILTEPLDALPVVDAESFKLKNPKTRIE